MDLFQVKTSHSQYVISVRGWDVQLIVHAQQTLAAASTVSSGVRLPEPAPENNIGPTRPGDTMSTLRKQILSFSNFHNTIN